MKNLNLLFNKTYYEDLGKQEWDRVKRQKVEKFNDNSLKDKNEALTDTQFLQDQNYEKLDIPDIKLIRMVTSYPGLLIGTGYAHGAGLESVTQDIDNGLSFDYVTGQPYIPGSSVKGMLSSCFAHEEVIKSLCENAKGIVPELRKKIFGAPAREECGADVFFDAVIFRGDSEKHIIGSDYITPHLLSEEKHEMSKELAGVMPPLVEKTNPIHILKIMPGVGIEFRFLLQESQVGGKTFSVEEKLELFTELLELFGIGAKTNVGYGVLTRWSESTAPAQPAPAPAQTSAQQTIQSAPTANNAQKPKPKVPVGTVLEGEVTGKDVVAYIKTKELGRIEADTRFKPMRIESKVWNGIRVKDKVQIKITGVNSDGEYSGEVTKLAVPKKGKKK